jgi:hypothetical protein
MGAGPTTRVLTIALTMALQTALTPCPLTDEKTTCNSISRDSLPTLRATHTVSVRGGATPHTI